MALASKRGLTIVSCLRRMKQPGWKCGRCLIGRRGGSRRM
jgi:hypothetical protein